MARDVYILNANSWEWKVIEKSNSVIVSSELGDSPQIIKGGRLLPFPERNNIKPKIFSFSSDEKEFNSSFYPPDAEIIRISDDNFQELLNFNIGPTLYFSQLNIFRNQYNVTIAETVPVKGFYKIYALRLDPPRTITKRVNGEIIKEVAPWDLPYQIIGIGHWLSSEVPHTKALKFNEEISVEVRLNPLFNRISTVEGLDPNFPREKRWDTFYILATEKILWIKKKISISVRINSRNRYFLHHFSTVLQVRNSAFWLQMAT